MSLRVLLIVGVLSLVFWVLLLWFVVAGALAHVEGCHTTRCDRRVHAKRAQAWLKRERPWIWAWRHLTEHERAWARCIANYETRGIPWSRKRYTATGNGYYGSTQWLPSTWRAAGGSGLPIEHTLHEQLVRTVRWAHRAGSSQWSTSRWCGSV